ncbi:hypothetical protein O181_053110 [Austropuccinia psidii MF-1]|uniref:Uncharacterized protein n=1 Tax=Austropuccinia psidii MF-1 TaxID=1389203 RepID=A0A9Q3E685_9BASI|nr:hypothetical protein [Austropuccinia psidii MF-1]
MTTKLKKYLQILLRKKPYIFASVLDPQFKIRFFDNYNSTVTAFGISASEMPTMFEEEAKSHFTETNPTFLNTQKQPKGLFDEMYTPTGPEASTLENELLLFFQNLPSLSQPMFCSSGNPEEVFFQHWCRWHITT